MGYGWQFKAEGQETLTVRYTYLQISSRCGTVPYFVGMLFAVSGLLMFYYYYCTIRYGGAAHLR